MVINLGTIAMLDFGFEIHRVDVHNRTDQTHIYDLRIYRGQSGYTTLMFAHKEDRDIIYDEILEAMKENVPFDLDVSELYDVKYN
jgi:hypothetical protein